MRLPRIFVRKATTAASVEPVEPPPGVDLLALAAVTPETAEVLSDEELRRLEALCHKSVEEETASPLFQVTNKGIQVGKGSA